ncbi:hypothetical protein ACFV16_22130 [Streptomyces massasporeus]|uniref:hypothetical protein n=1 Tax=Streptomyces massasporeus TaxID=67324 RepID=UPI003699A7B3
MRTIWVGWAIGDMQDAADAEGHASLDALVVPEQRPVESLPYYGAFDDYRAHVTGCADCRRDDRDDCATGNAMATVARVGIEEQHRMAVYN